MAVPNLMVKVTYDDQGGLQKYFRAKEQQAEQFETKLTQTQTLAERQRQEKVATVQAVADAQRAEKKLSFEDRLNQDLARKDALFKQKLEQQQIAFQQRTQNAYKSWSGQIAKHMETAALAIKGLLIFQLGSAIKSSFEFTGQLSDQADAVGLNVRQFYALKEAAANVDVEGEAVEKILTRINVALQNPNEKQTSLFDRLGIDINQGAAPALDKLLTGVQQGKINLSDLAEIVDKRSVLAFRKLALEVGTTDEAMKKFNLNISEDGVRRLDKATDSWHRFFDTIKIASGSALAAWFEFVDNAVAGLRGLDESVRKAQMDIALKRSGNTGMLPGYDIVYDASSERAKQAALAAELAKQKWESWQATIKGTHDALVALGQDLPKETLEVINPLNAMDSVNKQMQGISGRASQDMQRRIDAMERFQVFLSNSSQVLGGLTNLAQAAFALQSVYFQNELQQQERLMQIENDRWSERSNNLQKAGLENSAIYRNEQRTHEASQKAMLRTENQLKSRAWESEKGARETGVAMTTAEAIVHALLALPNPLAFVLAGIAASTGALQFAAIEAQQNPYRGYATGGWIQGNDMRDKTPFYGTSGEFVTTRDNAARNARALEYMAAGGTISGGSTIININAPIIGTDQWVSDNLFPSMRKAIRNGHSFNN